MQKLIFIGAAALALAGCGDAPSASNPPAAPLPALPTLYAAPEAAELMAAEPAAGAAHAEGSAQSQYLGDPNGGEVDLAFLEGVLRSYVGETQKQPTGLQDLVAAGFLPRMPVAPPGKSFQLDARNFRVTLVGQ